MAPHGTICPFWQYAAPSTTSPGGVHTPPSPDVQGVPPSTVIPPDEPPDDPLDDDAPDDDPPDPPPDEPVEASDERSMSPMPPMS
jgi:hypothetical protein